MRHITLCRAPHVLALGISSWYVGTGRVGTCVEGAIELGRHAFMGLEELAKEREVGKVELVDDFLT